MESIGRRGGRTFSEVVQHLLATRAVVRDMAAREHEEAVKEVEHEGGGRVDGRADRHAAVRDAPHGRHDLFRRERVEARGRLLHCRLSNQNKQRIRVLRLTL